MCYSSAMNGSITLEVPADVLNAAKMTVDELRVELAIHLFEQGRLSLGRAAQSADMKKGDFVPLLERLR
jgi:predicted HTH domain antitoxin